MKYYKYEYAFPADQLNKSIYNRWKMKTARLLSLQLLTLEQFRVLRIDLSRQVGMDGAGAGLLSKIPVGWLGWLGL